MYHQTENRVGENFFSFLVCVITFRFAQKKAKKKKGYKTALRAFVLINCRHKKVVQPHPCDQVLTIAAKYCTQSIPLF